MDLFCFYLSDLKKKNRLSSLFFSKKRASLGKRHFHQKQTRLSAREKEHNNIENNDNEKKNVVIAVITARVTSSSLL
jgi:hypothetical protein